MGTGLLDRETEGGLTDVAHRMMHQKLSGRSREQVLQFFHGTDLAPPGLERGEEWRPDPGANEATRSSLWGGTGRKR